VREWENLIQCYSSLTMATPHIPKIERGYARCRYTRCRSAQTL